MTETHAEGPDGNAVDGRHLPSLFTTLEEEGGYEGEEIFEC